MSAFRVFLAQTLVQAVVVFVDQEFAAVDADAVEHLLDGLDEAGVEDRFGERDVPEVAWTVGLVALARLAFHVELGGAHAVVQHPVWHYLILSIPLGIVDF